LARPRTTTNDHERPRTTTNDHERPRTTTNDHERVVAPRRLAERRRCTHVGVESTGEDWKPVFNLLEGSFEVWLLNAAHIKAAHSKAAHSKAAHIKAAHSKAAHSKAVPGRKTDVKDAQWIAELLAHGLVRPSFIPPRAQRELRDLTRSRTTFVRERVNLVNRVHKALASANLKLASVATDSMGVWRTRHLGGVARRRR